MSAAILEREHFTISQETKYFTLDNLARMIGQEPNQWRHAALKELLDNALDAAESVYPATPPVIDIEFTEGESGLILSVADNAPAFPPRRFRTLPISAPTAAPSCSTAPRCEARKATPSKP